MTASPTPPTSAEIASALGTKARRVKAPPMTDAVRKSLVRKHDAIPDAFGLYLEGIVYDREGRLVHHAKAFLAENMVATQVRDRGNRAGRWVRSVYSNENEARAKLAAWLLTIKGNAELKGGGFEMRGTPRLVQMTRADVAELRANRMPVARFAGYNDIVHTEGKLDDDAWRPSAKSSSFGGPS